MVVSHLRWANTAQIPRGRDIPQVAADNGGRTLRTGRRQRNRTWYRGHGKERRFRTHPPQHCNNPKARVGLGGNGEDEQPHARWNWRTPNRLCGKARPRRLCLLLQRTTCRCRRWRHDLAHRQKRPSHRAVPRLAAIPTEEESPAPPLR